MNLLFSKYQGTGNDFIILDNRDGRYDKLKLEQIHLLCDRRFGIGADGLMMLGNAEGYDFSMAYFNADGKEGSMCGNGGRCLVSFANHIGIHKTSYKFIATDGEHSAEIDLGGLVRLKMKDVDKVKQVNDHYELDTGSPHFVRFISEVKTFDVTKEGRAIRSSKEFLENGINVNFVQNVNDHTIFVRTYERGVEAETLSCGTGVTASALMAAHNDNGFNQVDVVTLGGKLSVEFDRTGENEFRNIWLIGPAAYVFSGQISVK
jgi:diaminopimelate epimerase